MSHEDTILAQIDEHVREVCEIEDDPDYSVDTNLFDNGYMDSLEGAELILYLEGLFGIEITQKDIVMYSMTTVREIADVVRMKTER